MRNLVAKFILRFWRLRIVVLAVVCTVGCKTVVVHSEADAFFLNQPEMRTRYVRLDSTSPALLSEQADMHYWLGKRLVDSLRPEIDNNSVLKRHLDWAEKVGGTNYDSEIKKVKEISTALEQYGGQCYFYEFRDGELGETGYAILSFGEIKGKFGVIKSKINISNK
jgi:hypothetical protein